jgi:hypothetical protein
MGFYYYFCPNNEGKNPPPFFGYGFLDIDDAPLATNF